MKCGHCDIKEEQIDEKFVVTILMPFINKQTGAIGKLEKFFCCFQCLLCHQLDMIVNLNVMPHLDKSWYPVIRNLHDAIL